MWGARHNEEGNGFQGTAKRGATMVDKEPWWDPEKTVEQEGRCYGLYQPDPTVTHVSSGNPETGISRAEVSKWHL